MLKWMTSRSGQKKGPFIPTFFGRQGILNLSGEWGRKEADRKNGKPNYRNGGDLNLGRGRRNHVWENKRGNGSQHPKRSTGARTPQNPFQFFRRGIPLLGFKNEPQPWFFKG